MRRGFRRRHEMLDLTFGPQPPELFELPNGAIVGDRRPRSETFPMRARSVDRQSARG
jgi:hypothetical protein